MKKILKPELLAAMLFLFTFARLFLINPIVSVADNGDFDRLMFSVGLGKFPDTFQNSFFSFAQIKYIIHYIVDFGVNGYITTHALCAFSAKLINVMFYSKEVFDVRFIALIYTLAAVGGVYMLVGALKTGKWYLDYPMIALLWLMLCDASYTSYMNSLYGEGSSYAFLLLLLGVSAKIIKDKPQNHDIVLLFIAFIMFFGSKLQYTLLFPLALIFLVPLKIDHKISRRHIIYGFMILAALNVAIYMTAPRGLAEDTLYNSVFYGILKDSEDIHTDAQMLGVESQYEYLAGTNAYTEGTPRMTEDPKFHQSFYSKASRMKVMTYYLTHIPKFLKKMEITASASFDNIRGMFGNYTKEAGFKANETNKSFTSYNTVKQKHFPKNFLFLFLYFAVYFGMLYLFFKNKNTPKLDVWFMFMLLLIGVSQFPLPVLGNGEADIAKQLYVFNLVFDISILYAIFKGTKLFINRIEKGRG